VFLESGILVAVALVGTEEEELVAQESGHQAFRPSA
jgi:hypothetical protein